MLDTTIAYPEFVPNQILTDRQLNQLRLHLEQQDLLTRIRLTGTGIVCGLHARTTSAPAHGVQIAKGGYGVTSDGHLIDFCDAATYTHQRPYADPDRDEDGKLRYVLWRSAANPTQQLDIIELIPREVMEGDDPPDADAFTAATLASAVSARVLVLYVEHQPVDLNSCLVTSCDNKGRNINLNVRALLVKKTDLTAAAGCAAAPPIHRVPRLHTRGVPQPASTGGQITQAFSDLVTANAPAVSGSIKVLFDAYTPFLNMTTIAADPLAGRLTGAQIAQYRYDALLDLTAAYNEAAAAAHALVKECCPAGTFPRHLMLGVLDGSAAAGFRNEFTPSAARNVIDGEIDRVRDLFKRLDAMIFALDLDGNPAAVSIRPSHTTAYPLGRRARPFYFAGAGMNTLWRPRPRCTVDPDWPWLHPLLAAGLATDYTEATLLRIEGHIGDPWDAARTAIVAKRDEGNAEFHVLCSYLDAGLAEEQQKRAQLMERLRAPLEAADPARNAFADWVVSGKEVFDAVVALAKQEQERRQRLSDLSADWVTLRERRRLQCDATALANDYLQTRSDLLCAVAGARGMVRRVLADLAIVDDESLIGPGLEAMLDGVRFTLVDHLVGAAVAAPDDWDTPGEILNQLGQAGKLSGRSALRLALVMALRALEADLRRIAGSQLPPSLPDFDFDLFSWAFRRAVALSREIWHWLRALGLGIPGAQMDVGGDTKSDAPLHEAEAALLAAGWLNLRTCLLARLAAISAAYEAIRAGDVSLFRNLASIDGLEHLAGVSKGGTFVLVCDNVSDAGRVVADFSLESPVPCCCRFDAAALCVPPLASPDVRIVALTPDGEGGYGPVTLLIDVTANDTDLNVPPGAAKIGLPSQQSERGGSLGIQQDIVVVYETPDNARPGMVDRFSYDLGFSGRCDGTARGDVVVIFAIAPVKEGRIEGFVVREDTGGRGDDAIVTIIETGAQLMTSGSGDFAFEDIQAGRYTLRATQDEMQSDPVAVDVFGGQTTVVQIVLKIPTDGPKPGTIIIRVLDPTGGVLPGVNVSLTGPVTRSSVTNATGVAHFANLPAGRYVGVATFPGAVNEPIDPIDLGASQTATREIVLRAKPQLVVPSGAIEFVAIERDVPLLDASVDVQKVVGARYKSYVTAFNAATDDPEVITSEAYTRAAKFLAEGLTDPAVSDDALATEYEEASAALAEAARVASGETKTAYQEALAGMTAAYLDRVALSNPDTLSAERSTEIARAVDTLHTAGVTTDRVEAKWEGATLKETGVRSTDAIVRILR
jgi:hypothetical protein